MKETKRVPGHSLVFVFEHFYLSSSSKNRVSPTKWDVKSHSNAFSILCFHILCMQRWITKSKWEQKCQHANRMTTKSPILSKSCLLAFPSIYSIQWSIIFPANGSWIWIDENVLSYDKEKPWGKLKASFPQDGLSRNFWLHATPGRHETCSLSAEKKEVLFTDIHIITWKKVMQELTE